MVSMQISKKLVQSIVKAAKETVPLPHYRLFLFGSRVEGVGSDRSDYDLGIEAGKKIPLETLSDLREKIEEIPVLQKFDLVDFSRVAKGFSREAKKHIQILYEK